jgi:hypothetical protein
LQAITRTIAPSSVKLNSSANLQQESNKRAQYVQQKLVRSSASQNGDLAHKLKKSYESSEVSDDLTNAKDSNEEDVHQELEKKIAQHKLGSRNSDMAAVDSKN